MLRRNLSIFNHATNICIVGVSASLVMQWLHCHIAIALGSKVWESLLLCMSRTMAQWRSHQRVLADAWCSVEHLKRKLPHCVFKEIDRFFDFESCCRTWLDPDSYQNITGLVAEWHSSEIVSPTGYEFKHDYICPGWVLCRADYNLLCRWNRSCITPRIIALSL